MGRNSDEMDLRKIRRLLRETTRLAERASMTGSLQGGGRIAIRQYNAIRNHLQDTGVIPEDLFQELDEDEATFDELGVVTGMLESYLEEDQEPSADAEAAGTEEECCGEEGREGRRGRRGRRGRFEWGAWFGPGGAGRFDPQALRDMQQMGEELRQHMPEILFWRDQMRRSRDPGAPPTPPSPPEAPVPPTPPGAPEAPTPEESHDPHAWRRWDAESTGPAAQERIRQIAQELAAEGLDESRRAQLTRELTELVSSL
ncbi:MAG TPA: hypothetical protein VKT77_10985 [Chthonomonadaceae bacterium]|nr:hypothetical protein [Chthonomonadaceae bacterium]